MQKGSTVLKIYLIVFITAASAISDQIVFKNGDRITGTVKQMTDGKLVVCSDIAGDITIDMSKIESIRTDAKVEMHMSDGTVVHDRLASISDQTYIPDTNQTPVTIDLTQIAALNPPASEKPKWTGDVAAGLSSSHGNTRADRINISGNLKKRREKDRVNLSFDLTQGKQRDSDTGEMDTIEDWWRAIGKYDYFFTKKLFGYVDVRYETDEIAQLDRRVVYGAGPGYQWIETERLKFSTLAGFASVYEKFENETSNTDCTLQLGYDLNFKVNSVLTFSHDLNYYPVLENISDYYLTSEAELRAALWSKMFASFKVIFDYDTSPARQASNTDVKYLFGVGWTF